MVNWWSVIKFDPVGTYIKSAIKDFVRNKPDASDNEILEHISDLDNIYDEYDMVREEDKRVGTMKDIDSFNEGHNRGKYSGETLLNDYQKDIVIPLIQELSEKRDPRKGALIGSALERELAKDPKINKSTLEEDLRIIFKYFVENDNYKGLRTLDTVLTEEGNPDFVATEERRKEQLGEREKITFKKLKEKLEIRRILAEKRKEQLRRGAR